MKIIPNTKPKAPTLHAVLVQEEGQPDAVYLRAKSGGSMMFKDGVVRIASPASLESILSEQEPPSVKKTGLYNGDSFEVFLG